MTPPDALPRFPGFPSSPQYVPIPKVYCSDVLPLITDHAELVVSLHLFRLLAAKRGYPPAVARHLLTDDPLLVAGFTAQGRDARAEAERGLALALQRCVFLEAAAPGGGSLLLLNNSNGQRAAAAIRRGEVTPSGEPAPPARPISPAAVAGGDVYTLYEENIGMLTPILAEQLAEAEREYPAGWIAEAVKIAVAANQRHWRYIAAILERWKAEGKDDGKPARHTGPARRATDYSDWLPVRPPNKP